MTSTDILLAGIFLQVTAATILLYKVNTNLFYVFRVLKRDSISVNVSSIAPDVSICKKSD